MKTLKINENGTATMIDLYDVNTDTGIMFLISQDIGSNMRVFFDGALGYLTMPECHPIFSGMDEWLLLYHFPLFFTYSRTVLSDTFPTVSQKYPLFHNIFFFLR